MRKPVGMHIVLAAIYKMASSDLWFFEDQNFKNKISLFFIQNLQIEKKAK